MVIDQVLPDGHGVASPPDGLDDQLAVGLTGARLRRAAGAVPGHRHGVTRAGRRCSRRVGGHLRRNGRFCRTSGRPATAAHRQAGPLQVAAGGLTPDPGGPFDSPQRPAEASQREDLLSFLFSQDVAHGRAGTSSSRPVSTSRAALRNGRFSRPLTWIMQCAVTRRHSSAGANPARQLSLQPVAVGADDGGNDIG